MSVKEQTEGVLGRQVSYPKQYAPDVLVAISRIDTRLNLEPFLLQQGLAPLYGEDVWRAYEVSWLNMKGKPVSAWAEIRVPVTSVNIIESKSFKLYLNSFNHTRFNNQAVVIATLEKDLSILAGADVSVVFFDVGHQVLSADGDAHCGVLLDGLDIEISKYHHSPELLCKHSSKESSELLYSHLLRSSCPVTGQPDWGSVFISYTGPSIDHASLLRYIISFRNQQEFHEQCIERMFYEIWHYCQPKKLTIKGQYLRRGGLDINPIRSSDKNYHADIYPINRQ